MNVVPKSFAKVIERQKTSVKIELKLKSENHQKLTKRQFKTKLYTWLSRKGKEKILVKE